MDLSKMSLDELVALHRAKRSQLAAVRQEMDAIEAVLLPRQNRAGAIRKLERAGLTKAELEALKS